MKDYNIMGITISLMFLEFIIYQILKPVSNTTGFTLITQYDSFFIVILLITFSFGFMVALDKTKKNF